MPTETDVLIVGAGPAGLTLAAALKRLGVAVLVVDKQATGANTSRAAVVHARTLEVLQRIGATPELLAQGLRVPTFHVRERSESLLRVDFSALQTDYPFTLMCPQDRTEAVLQKRLTSLGGVVRRPVELTTIKIDCDHVDACLAGPDEGFTVRSRWLVGCDGAHSLVRSQARIPFEGGSYDDDFVLADIRMDWPLPRDEIDLFFSPAGLMVVAPLPDDRFRVVATVRDAPAQLETQYIQALVDERGPAEAAASVHEIVWSSRFHIQHRVTSTPRQGRVLLCGDAAHVHSPAGGQGMNTGIQDAIGLSEPLAAALRSGDTQAIDQWAARRHSVARNVVRLTDRMTRAATIRSSPARLLRNGLLRVAGQLPGVTSAIARRLAELDLR